MSHSRSRTTAAVFGIALLLMSINAGSASAATSDIYNACGQGGSLSGYSKAELESALGGVPADLDEYYGCTAQINAALVNLATKDIPGGGKTGVKGTKQKLKTASVNDLTTPAERKKLRAQVARESQLDSSKPLTPNSDPAISEAAGQTLASTAAPGTPTALIIGVLGLLVLLGADLAGRLGKMPRVKKFLPWSGQRDDG